MVSVLTGDLIEKIERIEDNNNKDILQTKENQCFGHEHKIIEDKLKTKENHCIDYENEIIEDELKTKENHCEHRM